MRGDEPTGHDDRDRENQGNPNAENHDETGIPASVTFMEMMRQAAARAEQPPTPAQSPSYTDPVIPTRRVKSTETAVAAIPDAPPMTVNSAPLADMADESGSPEEVPDDPMEEQRVRRIKRRKTRRRRRTVGVLGGIFRSVIIVGVAAGLMATIFTWWTPTGFLSDNVRQELSVAIATSAVTLQPTGLPTPNWLRRVGIVSGHRGPNNDPGAVCPDGLTEASTVFNVAQLVVRNLRGRGYTVDLLDEFDPRLNNYQAAALMSIHANTCQDWGEVVSGYLIAAAAARVTARGNDDELVDCVARHYAQASGLQRREGVTGDMTDYHTFREINALTPAAIIELGFLLADRQVLTEQPDTLARGISDGIVCFLDPGSEPQPEQSAS